MVKRSHDTFKMKTFKPRVSLEQSPQTQQYLSLSVFPPGCQSHSLWVGRERERERERLGGRQRDRQTDRQTEIGTSEKRSMLPTTDFVSFPWVLFAQETLDRLQHKQLFVIVIQTDKLITSWPKLQSHVLRQGTQSKNPCLLLVMFALSLSLKGSWICFDKQYFSLSV